jgi:hypothetical protein
MTCWLGAIRAPSWHIHAAGLPADEGGLSTVTCRLRAMSADRDLADPEDGFVIVQAE